MSSNLEKLCQVSIEISRPIADTASFDAILILGPGPKNGLPVPPVTVYSSLNEATDAGYLTTGDKADPVGTALRVAFSQSPAPTAVYVAVQQRTAEAVAAGVTIGDVNDTFQRLVGVKENLTGCELNFDPETRKLFVELSGPVSGVKNTGLVEALKSLMEQGYTVCVGESEIKNAADIKKLPEFKAIAGMTMGGADFDFLVTIKKEGANDVNYAVAVSWPDPNAPAATAAKSDVPLDAPDQELEDISATLARAAGTDGWYIVCPAGVSEEKFEEIAQWTETQEKMFAYTTLSTTNPVAKVYYRSQGWFGGEFVGQDAADTFEANRYLHVAACAKILRYEPGSETWAHKQLAAVNASKLTTADCKTLEAEQLNYFITVASRPITMFGQTCAGEWIDLIRFRDWLKNDMQVRVANLMATRRKIPYTDGGIALVENQMISSLKAGVRAGGIAPVEFDEDGNENPSFVTHVPRAASLTATEKASRVLKHVTFQTRIAGAIHMVTIDGNLTYDNLM